MTAAPPTILLVNDNAEMRAFLRKHLTDEHQVRVAASGQEAWGQIQSDPPDLLLCDAQLPEMGGQALCRQVKENEAVPSIPVLLLGTPPDAEDAGGEATDEVLEKPFATAELRRRMDPYLPERELPDAESPFLEEVLRMMERQLHDPHFSVEDLAEALSLSRRHLTRRVKAEADTTPAALLRARRIERAKTQLEKNPDTVREVGEAVGFRSASHFSQVFRDEVGCSPSTYREQHVP